MRPLYPRTGCKFRTANVQTKASFALLAAPLDNVHAGQPTACAGQTASAKSASNPVWQDFLDYSTVAKELQATQAQSRSQPQSPRDTPTAGGQADIQHKHDEAAGPKADCATAPAGIPGTPPIVAFTARMSVKSTASRRT